MCESFCGCAPRRNFSKIKFKFFKLVLNKINFFSRNERECVSLLGMRSAQKFFKNQIQIFQIV